jgi:hypothetical protein
LTIAFHWISPSSLFALSSACTPAPPLEAVGISH